MRPINLWGSGMLPAGAYVTLEHEYILILRKGSKREFKTECEKQNRRESALFILGEGGISGIRMFGWILRARDRGFLLGNGFETNGDARRDRFSDGRDGFETNRDTRRDRFTTCPPRLRSAAFPYELAYRLVNMYSVKGDVILDPFLGTGTTIAAAMTSGTQ